MPLSKAEAFWKNYDEDRDPTEAGGGVISRGEILTGYQVFPEDGRPTFFRADVGDEAGRKTALAAAREIGGRPQWGVMIRADKDASYKMADDGTYSLVTWKENREEFCAKFTDGFKEVFVPAFQELGVVPPWQGYFRLGWKPDPFATKKGEAGKTETFNDEPRFPQIMFPLELYVDAAAAQAAVQGVTSEGKVIPVEWQDDEAGWKDEIIAIKEQVGTLKGKKLKNAVAKYLAAEYGDTEDETGVTGLGATVAEVLDWLSL
jgi:hypothetical protein